MALHENDALLNVEEAAKYLGISPYTVRNWIRDRKIAFVHVGRRVKIYRSTLDAILDKGAVPEGGRAA